MSSFNVINLARGAAVDLGDHLDGGWGQVRLLELDAAVGEYLVADEVEICLFVIDGHGTVTMDEHVVELRPGAAVTLVKGSTATLATDTRLQLFTAQVAA
jgi:uncharacterized cupin superfamily protein